MLFNTGSREVYALGQATGKEEWRTLRFEDR
jgi:hypothetical protein